MSLEFALPYATMTCWRCDYPRADEFRFCPNCGLWLMNERPIRTVRSFHDGSVTMRLDVRGPACLS